MADPSSLTSKAASFTATASDDGDTSNMIDSILQMGFTRDQAEQALHRHNYDLARTINALLDEPDFDFE